MKSRAVVLLAFFDRTGKAVVLFGIDIFLLSTSNSGSKTKPESLLNDSTERDFSFISTSSSLISVESILLLLSVELMESSLDCTSDTLAVSVSLSRLNATRLPLIALICSSSRAIASSGFSGTLLLVLLFSKKLKRDPERFSSAVLCA